MSIFDSLQSELTLDASSYIKDAKKAEDASDDLADSTEELSDKAEESSKGLSSAEKAVGAVGVATAGLSAAGIGAAVSSFGDFDQKLTQSEAIMGDVSDSMDRELATTAEDTASRLGISADDAAESYYYLSSAGLDAQQSLTAMPGVADFAAAGQTDMATATDLATDAMEAYQLPASKLTKVTDAMTAGVTRHNQTLEGMGEAFNYVAPIASNLGVNVDELSASLGFLGDVGIKSTRAGTAMRAILSTLASPTGRAKKALKKLGVQTTDASGQMRPFTDILRDLKAAGASTGDVMAIFGREAGPAAAALLQKGGDAIDEESKKISSMGGITREVAQNQMQTMNKQLDVLKSKFQNLLIDTGRQLAPFFTRLITGAQGLVDAFISLNDSTGGLASVLVLITGLVGGLAVAAAALGPAILDGVAVLQGAAAVIGELSVASIAAGAIEGLGAAFAILTGPVGLALAAVAALALAWKSDFGNIREITASVVSQVRGYISSFVSWARGAWSAIAGTARKQFQAIADTIDVLLLPVLSEIVSGFRQFVGQITGSSGGIAAAFHRAFDPFVSSIVPAVQTGLRVVGTLIRGLVGVVSEVLSAGLALARGDWDGFWESLQFVVVRALGAVKDAIFQLPLSESLKAKIQSATSAFLNGWAAIVTRTRAFVGTVITVLRPLLDWFRSSIGPAITAARATIRTAFAGIQRTVTAAVATVTALLSGNWAAAWRGLKKTVSLALAAVTGTIRTAVAGFGPILRRGLAALQTVVRNGITAAFNWLRTSGVALARKAMSLLAKGAMAAFKFGKSTLLPAVMSAVRLAWNWVKTSGVSLGKQALRALARGAVAAFKFGKQNLLPAIIRGVRGAWNWITSTGVSLGKRALSTLATKAINAFHFGGGGGSGGGGGLTAKIRQGITGAFNWLKSAGATIARKAVGALGKVVLKAIGAIFGTNAARKVVLFVHKIQTTWTKLRAHASKIWNGIKQAVSGAISGLKRAVLPTIRTVKQAVLSAWNRIAPQARKTWNAWKKAIAGVINWAKTNIVPPIKQAVSGIVSTFQKLVAKARVVWSRVQFAITKAVAKIRAVVGPVISKIVAGVRTAFGKLAGIARTAWNGLKKIVAGVVHALAPVVHGALKLITGVVRTQFRIARGIAQTVWKAIKAVVGTAIDGVVTVVVAALKLLRGDWKGALNEIKSFGERVWNGIKRFLGSTIQGIADQAGRVWSGMKDTAHRLWNALKDAVVNAATTLKDKAVSAANDLKRRFVSAVTDLGNSALRLFHTLREKAVSAVQTLVSNAVSKANDLKRQFVSTVTNLGNDALRLFHTLRDKATTAAERLASNAISAAKDLVNGVLDWFKKLPGKAKFWVSQMASTVMDYLTGRKGPLSGARKAGKGLITAFTKGIGDKIGAVGDAVDNIVQKARDKLPGSDAKEGPLSDISKAGAALPATVAKHALANKRVLSRASEALAAAARPALATTFAMSASTTAGSGSISQSATGPTGLSSVSYSSGSSGSSGGDTQRVEVVLSVEGDDELARLIRENAEVQIEKRESDQQLEVNASTANRADMT